MSQGAFEKLEGPKAKKFIDRLNKAWAGSPFDTERTVVHARALSFADDWILAEASDATSVPEKRCVALDNGRECSPIRFDADFIPAFANQNNLTLNADTAPDYVRFWFEYARQSTDRFLLVEAIDDLPWREEPTPQARKSLAKIIQPVELTDMRKDAFSFTACLLFRDTLFAATLDVMADGRISVTSRKVIAESLTVSDPLTGL